MKSGYLYLAYNPLDGLYKIGFSERPRGREPELQRETGAAVRLLCCSFSSEVCRLEQIVHGCFESLNVYQEWFALQPEDVANFQKTVRKAAREKCSDCGPFLSRKEVLWKFRNTGKPGRPPKKPRGGKKT